MTVTAMPFCHFSNDLRMVAYALEAIEFLTFGRNGFSASCIASELRNNKGAAVLLLDDGKVVGYTAAMDADELYGMNSIYRDRDSEGAAYISNSSLHPDYQHKGYIWLMMEILEAILKAKGFAFLDRDSLADKGYADKIVQHYGDRVVFARPPEATMWGSQRYIRVRL